MTKRIQVGLSGISKEEWHEFRLACLKNKTTITQVLLKAVRDYLKGEGQK